MSVRANVVDLAAYRAAHPRPEPAVVREIRPPIRPTGPQIQHRRQMLQHLAALADQARGSG